MLALFPNLAITLSLLLAWRAGAAPRETRGLNRRLLSAFGLALLLRIALGVLQDMPGGVARDAVAVIAELVALALFWLLAGLALMAPYKKRGRITRAVFLALATLMIWLGQSAPAIFFLWLGLTRYPWLKALDTGERFRVSLAALAVTLALLFGVNRIHGLPPVAAEAQSVAWIVRDSMMVYCLFGTLRAFKAFTTDPTLGVRTVSRRLALSHVLVVTVPLLIVVALWISSTYLGVNADHALVTARAVSREEERLHAELAIALGAGGDLDVAARAVADSRRAKWPGTRVFVIQDSLVRRVSGDVVESEQLLPGWVAGLDSLPDRGVVQLANRRWLGAAARQSGRALVLLAPVRELMDSTLSPLVGVTVSMAIVGHDTPEMDSLATWFQTMRDTLRHERRRGSRDGDSLLLARGRAVVRAFEQRNWATRVVPQRNPAVAAAQRDTLHGHALGTGLTGQVVVRGVRRSRIRWLSSDFTLTARASFRSTLGGLFSKLRDNPLQAIPVAALVGLALLLLPLAHTNLKMVRGMGGSITQGIDALRDGAAAFGAGQLAHRIPIAGDDDVWDTARRFNDMAEGLERARELAKDRDRLDIELEVARHILARLLPTALNVPGLDVAGLSESAREVGGDYYDHFDLGGRRVLLVVADVSGKGVPAALLMSGFRASLMSQDTTNDEPDVLARRVNAFLHRSVEPGTFVTAFFGFLHADSGRFVYVNAGHNPPLLLRADGTLERLCDGGLILGFMPNPRFMRGEITLERGDLLVLYTDGVTEGADAANEQFGEERLVELVRTAHTSSSSDLARRIVRKVRSFEGALGPADDITVLVVRRSGGAKVSGVLNQSEGESPAERIP
jgi:serine phosphatase RsbU (regulator of sigma subunit)